MSPRIPRLIGLVLLGAASLAAFAPQRAARADWPEGGIVLSDTTRFLEQLPGVIARDGSGGVYVVWANYGYEDPDFIGEIHIQRVTMNADIGPGWPQTDGLMLARASDGRDARAIAVDAGGGVFVLWEDRGHLATTNYDVYGTRVLGTGTIAPGWPFNGLPIANTSALERFPYVFTDSEGAAFVAWMSEETEVRPRVTRILPDGSYDARWPAGGLVLDVGSGGYSPGGVFDDGQGRCLVSFGGTVGGVVAQYATRLAADGMIVLGWPADYVSLLPPGIPANGGPMLPDGVGGFYVVWEDLRTYPGSPANPDHYTDLYALHWLADGTRDTRWPAAGLPIAVAPLKQWDSRLVLAENGDLWVVWRDNRAYALGTGTAQDVYGQRVRPDGTLAPGFPAHGRPVVQSWDSEEIPRAVTDGADGLYIVFNLQAQGTNGIQHVVPDGSADPEYGLDGAPIRIGGDVMRSVILSWDGYRGAYVAWSEFNRAGYGRGDQIYLKHFGPPVPTAVTVTLVSSEATPERVSLVWSLVEVTRVTIERRAAGGEWQALGTAIADGTGRIAWEDREVVSGASYGYRLAYEDEAGGIEHSAEAWVEVPQKYPLALTGLVPNPATGTALSIAFTLPARAAGRLELMDVSGRRVAARELGDFEPGPHVVRLEPRGGVAPGVYWVRLHHDGRVLTRKGAVVR